MSLKKLAATFHSIFVFHFFLDERTDNQAMTTPQTSKPSPSSKPRTSCFPCLSWPVRTTKHCPDSGCSHRVTGYKSKFSCQVTAPQTPKPPRLSNRRTSCFPYPCWPVKTTKQCSDSGSGHRVAGCRRKFSCQITTTPQTSSKPQTSSYSFPNWPVRTTKPCSDSGSGHRVVGYRSKRSCQSDGNVKSQLKNVKKIASTGLKFASFVNSWLFGNCNKKKISNDNNNNNEEMIEEARSTGNFSDSNTTSTCDMRSSTADGDDDVFFGCSDMFKIESLGGFSSSHSSSIFQPPLWLTLFVWLAVVGSNMLEFAFFRNHQPKTQSSNNTNINNNIGEASRRDSTTSCDMRSVADADTDDDDVGDDILSCSSLGSWCFE